MLQCLLDDTRLLRIYAKQQRITACMSAVLGPVWRCNCKWIRQRCANTLMVLALRDT